MSGTGILQKCMVTKDGVEFLSQTLYRKEVLKVQSMANKRIKRLRDNGLFNSPALKKLEKNGIVKFSIKGKDFNQVQREYSKMKEFVNSLSSTVRGYDKVLKDMAKNTGVKYKNMKELRNISSKFFELSSKVEQYLRTVDNSASAFSYQQIWTAVNEYIQNAKIDLNSANTSVDDLISAVGDLLLNVESEDNLHDFGGDWIIIH